VNKTQAKRIIVGLLASQPERSDLGDGLSDERMREVIESKGRFSPEEQHILLTSGWARRRFYELIDLHRTEELLRWRQEGVISAVKVLTEAADSAQPRPNYLPGDGFALRIYPLSEDGKDWALSLELRNGAKSEILPGGRVRLVDAGNQVWLRGTVSEEGEVVGRWPYENQSPLERLKDLKQEGFPGKWLYLMPD